MGECKKRRRTVLGLIFTVSAILAYVAPNKSVMATPAEQGPVGFQANLVQNKVLMGSNGKVCVSLTLMAAEFEPLAHGIVQHADLVMVLDRSGSMNGQKIDHARQAVIRLIDRLTAKDRLALVTYSNGVNTHFPLVPMDDTQRRRVKASVRCIYPGGGTNLGGGLSRGIQILKQTHGHGRQRKVILISDGIANQGVTDPNALGGMAENAVGRNFSVNTVGVGCDFNEVLMTTIADHGAGRYYFLENPNAFAQVFEKELNSTRNMAASALELCVPLRDGVQLIHAGGYPIQRKKDYAVVHPGELLSGQQRKLFLTFSVPTHEKCKFNLGGFRIRFMNNGVAQEMVSNNDLTLSCVADKKEVMAAIDRETWGDQVVREDFNQLKETVATAVRKGKKKEALMRIQAYEAQKRAINADVGSKKVAENLEKDVQILRESVEDTFEGGPAVVAEKKKQRAKALQYDAYQIRRDKK